MSVSINGTNGLTFSDGTSQNTGATGFGFKNRIINGAMMIDQRNAGASVTPASTNYTLDRWIYNSSQSGKVTVQQNAGSVTPPAGFKNYLGVTSTSAYSITSSDYFNISQKIEGYNVADLGFGASGASTVTLSFWVRSSLTGTFGADIGNSGDSRLYPFSYTINASNTWEQKTVTITGDTSGTWLATNGVGLIVFFGLGVGSNYVGTANTWNGTSGYVPAGSTSIVGTNGATFYITGVQLEKGSTATSFDYRPYGTELQLCQRYFAKMTALNSGSYTVFGSGYANSTTLAKIYIKYPVTMRSSPTASQANLAIANNSVLQNLTGISNAEVGSDTCLIDATVSSGLTAGTAYLLYASGSSSAYLALSAEL